VAIPVEIFALDRGADGTLQHQLRKIVTEGILSGRFRSKDRLPSSRKLAGHLGISRITVTLAYTELQSDGYLDSLGRSGYFVSPKAPRREGFVPATDQGHAPVDWSRAIGQRFSGFSLPDKPAEWRNYPYRFIYGQTDDTLFDHHHWRLCAAQALGKREFANITSDAFERDDPELIKHIALHTLPRRGIFAAPSQILITLGAQNALWLCAQVLLNQRRTAVMENPGYMGLRAILQQTRCNLVYAPVDENGLCFEALPTGVDSVFITPSHHCPTNVTMPIERRKALLEHAIANDYMIVEDDYEFEISFARPSAPALKSLDPDGRVIYIGSFSKSLFPGLRLGYVVASEPFINEVRALRGTVLRHPPGLMQRTVANFLSLGHYDTLITRLGHAYKERRAVMADAIARTGLTLAQPQAAGGSSFWLRLPSGGDAEHLAVRLRQRGVLIEPGHWFFAPTNAPRNYYRLAYSSISTSAIPEGIQLIGEEIAQSGFM
jgi:GntR family transcriptional regulator / MocR family aminotransferase